MVSFSPRKSGFMLSPDSGVRNDGELYIFSPQAKNVTNIMFEQIIKSIQQLGSFSTEVATFVNKLRIKISRDFFLLKKNRFASLFISSIMQWRQYFVTDDGDELTLNLL
jgi:hypothetical protein